MLNPVASTSGHTPPVILNVTISGDTPASRSPVPLKLSKVTNSKKAARSLKSTRKVEIPSVDPAIKAEISNMPPILNETRTQYARRVRDAFPQLLPEQLAVFADVNPNTLSGSVLFRAETPGYNEMIKVDKMPHESPKDFGRRLKLQFPDYPSRDHAKVSGAAFSSLAEYPEFQRVTNKVLWARGAVETQQRVAQEETKVEWGVRLYKEHKLSISECSAVTGKTVGSFRKVIKRQNINKEKPSRFIPSMNREVWQQDIYNDRASTSMVNIHANIDKALADKNVSKPKKEDLLL